MLLKTNLDWFDEFTSSIDPCANVVFGQRCLLEQCHILCVREIILSDFGLWAVLGACEHKEMLVFDYGPGRRISCIYQR